MGTSRKLDRSTWRQLMDVDTTTGHALEREIEIHYIN